MHDVEVAVRGRAAAAPSNRGDAPRDVRRRRAQPKVGAEVVVARAAAADGVRRAAGRVGDALALERRVARDEDRQGHGREPRRRQQKVRRVGEAQDVARELQLRVEGAAPLRGGDAGQPPRRRPERRGRDAGKRQPQALARRRPERAGAARDEQEHEPFHSLRYRFAAG